MTIPVSGYRLSPEQFKLSITEPAHRIAILRHVNEPTYWEKIRELSLKALEGFDNLPSEDKKMLEELYVWREIAWDTFKDLEKCGSEERVNRYAALSLAVRYTYFAPILVDLWNDYICFCEKVFKSSESLAGKNFVEKDLYVQFLAALIDDVLLFQNKRSNTPEVLEKSFILKVVAIIKNIRSFVGKGDGSIQFLLGYVERITRQIENNECTSYLKLAREVSSLTLNCLKTITVSSAQVGAAAQAMNPVAAAKESGEGFLRLIDDMQAGQKVLDTIKNLSGPSNLDVAFYYLRSITRRILISNDPGKWIKLFEGEIDETEGTGTKFLTEFLNSCKVTKSDNRSKWIFRLKRKQNLPQGGEEEVSYSKWHHCAMVCHVVSTILMYHPSSDVTRSLCGEDAKIDFFRIFERYPTASEKAKAVFAEHIETIMSSLVPIGRKRVYSGLLLRLSANNSWDGWEDLNEKRGSFKDWFAGILSEERLTEKVKEIDRITVKVEEDLNEFLVQNKGCFERVQDRENNTRLARALNEEASALLLESATASKRTQYIYIAVSFVAGLSLNSLVSYIYTNYFRSPSAREYSKMPSSGAIRCIGEATELKALA